MRIQRLSLALLLTSGVINYIDRAALSVGLPLIRHDLGISVEQSGFLLSAFLWAYAFSQLPAGALVDRLGARIMLSAALGLWSLAQLFSGLVRGFWQFIAVRLVLGAGESPQFPTCARVVSDWFPRRQRGFATGIWNCSSSLGTAIAAPLLTFVMLQVGWRWMFAIMGGAGLVVALAAFAVHRNPGQVALTAEERAFLSEGDEPKRAMGWREWGSLLRARTTWGMILGFFGTIYVGWIYYSWLIQYFEIQWHLSIATTGMISAIPYVFGVLGSLAGGAVCDALVRRGVSPVASRRIPMVLSLFGTAVLTLVTAYAPSSTVALAAISGSIFLLYVSSSAAWAMTNVVVPTAWTATIGSIQNFGGYFGGAIAPIVTGFLVQATGSFRSALIVGAAVACASAIAHVTLARKPIDPPAMAEVGR